MSEHKGLPVEGYRPTQSQENLDLVNEGKVLEERIMRYIDKLQEHSQLDQRSIAAGKTQIQSGFMWTFRGVFQPLRITLPEDVLRNV